MTCTRVTACQDKDETFLEKQLKSYDDTIAVMLPQTASGGLD